MERGAYQTSPWGRKELDMTEQLTLSLLAKMEWKFRNTTRWTGRTLVSSHFLANKVITSLQQVCIEIVVNNF